MSSGLSDLGRFSDPSILILASLSEGPKHGYAMMQDIQAFAGVSLEPGTLYGALARLERRGWIKSEPAEDRRRPYSLSGEGAAAAREQLLRLERIATVGLGRLRTT